MADDPKLDRIDFDIVQALQNDARISNKELAAKVGLAPSSCLARTRKLVELGVVRGFVASIEPSAVGVRLQAMTKVKLSPHQKGVFDAFRDHCLAMPEVVGVYQLAGDEDFLVHSAVRDSEHLQRFAEELTDFPRIASISTALIFEATLKPLPVYDATLRA